MLLLILEKMRSFESMTLSELFGVGSEHGKDYDLVDVAAKNKGVAARLTDIGHDDRTQLSRLRLGGKRRLYGFREDNVFYVLWWDPEHDVYPSPKKNT